MHYNAKAGPIGAVLEQGDDVVVVCRYFEVGRVCEPI